MAPKRDVQLTQDVVAQMAEPHFAFVPRQPVRRGDTWLQSSDLGLGSIGSFRMESKLTYDGRAAGLHRILIDHNMKYLPAKGDASLPFTIKSADYKSSSGKGEMLFDAARGRLVSSTASTTLDGAITIEVGGMETKVTLHSTQSMRIRVTDANPLLQRQQ